MTKRRISDKAKSRYKNRVRDIIGGLSRPVSIINFSKSECTNCFYDKYTGTSTGNCKWTAEQAEAKQVEWEVTNPGQLRYKYFDRGRCPVCRGAGSIDIENITYVNCVVGWAPDSRFGNDSVYTVAGATGLTTIELKTHPKYVEVFKTSDLVVVDGVKCKVSKPPVIRGLGNQSILIITCFTSDKARSDSGEEFTNYSR